MKGGRKKYLFQIKKVPDSTMRRSPLPVGSSNSRILGPVTSSGSSSLHEIIIIRHLRGALKNPSKTPDDVSTKARLADPGVRIVVEAVGEAAY